MPEATADNERAMMGRQHIFVINGEPDFLDAMRALFQGEDHNVTTTNYVPNSFDQIAALQPALLIVDLAVGQRAGWDLLAQLHQAAETRKIPVIVVSTNEQLLEEAKVNADLDGDAFLSKPFDIDELMAAVRRLIGRA